jgi:predicted HTH domain antitoxin
MSAEGSQAFVKQATALLYYTSKGVSLGYCAQIAEMSKMDFIRFLSENGVSVFDISPDELARDIANA